VRGSHVAKLCDEGEEMAERMKGNLYQPGVSRGRREGRRKKKLVSREVEIKIKRRLEVGLKSLLVCRRAPVHRIRLAGFGRAEREKGGECNHPIRFIRTFTRKRVRD